MISTDYAPNESWDDALVALKTLLQPWKWFKGKQLISVKRKLKNYFASLEVFLFLTGRTALYHILKSLELPEGTEIIVQAFTCEAVVLPIIKAGLKPVYTDIDPVTFSTDAKRLEKKITSNTKILILQHTFGIKPQRDEILNIAKKHKLFIIEDLAHGFGHYEKKDYDKLGNHSAIILSFGRSKAVSSVFGGAVATSDNRLIEKLKAGEKLLSLPSPAFICRSLLYKPLACAIKATYHLQIGKIIHKLITLMKLIPAEITAKEKGGSFDDMLNRGYPNALAMLLIQQLKKMDKMNKQRVKIGEIYNQYFNERTNIASPLLRYPLLVDNREKILKKSRSKRIFLGKWYEQAVAPKALNLKKVYYTSGLCPQAEKTCDKIINLPTLISKKEALTIIQLFK